MRCAATTKGASCSEQVVCAYIRQRSTAALMLTFHGEQLIALCCTLVSCVQGEDLKVLPKAKLGSNHWVFLTAAMPAAQLGASTHGSAGSSGGSSVHSEQTA